MPTGADVLVKDFARPGVYGNFGNLLIIRAGKKS